MIKPCEMTTCPRCNGEGVFDPQVCEICEVYQKYGSCLFIEQFNPDACPYGNVCDFCLGCGEVPAHEAELWHEEEKYDKEV